MLPHQRKQVDFLSVCRPYPCLFAVFMSVQSVTVVSTKKLPLQTRFTPADYIVWEPPSSHCINLFMGKNPHCLGSVLFGFLSS